MKTVNATGELCPKPLMMTSKALKEIGENESLLILVDNEASMQNVNRFLQDNGMDPQIRQDGQVFHITVERKGDEFEKVNAADYCEVMPATSDHIVVFQKNKMGEGSDELGEILMKGFVNTLPEADTLPQTMIFLNSGVLLTTSGSLVIEAIKKLENEGVEVLSCGTCLDYYRKMKELEVGVVSNMYEIIGKLTRAGKIIYP